MNGATETTKLCAVDARVVRCTPICHEHVVVEFTLPALPPSQPGQFLQLRCRGVDDAAPRLLEWSGDEFPSLSTEDLRIRQSFLRRPFSIADRWSASDGTVHLCVISRSVGPGTRWLEHLRPGDTLNLTGPLGRGFRIPRQDVPLVLVGGGGGIPPLLYLTRRLHELGRRGVTAMIGVRTRNLLPLRLANEPAVDATPLPCVEFPGQACFPTVITSDDGSVGYPGVVTDGLREWHKRGMRRDQPAAVFACGPEGMLKAVARLTRELGLACQLCIERNMGCGMGACLSCVVRARDPSRPSGWRWALTCAEGPVFERDDLLDYGSDPGA